MKKQMIYSLLKAPIVFAMCAFSSCSDMYDTLKDFATEETIYPAGFDMISGQVGFERVEIDLSTQGRIPASEMKLAKARKTVIECDYFDKPIVIDSVCSWVNITGLTEPESYTFKIYTEDELGNRSIPSEIALIPYTTADLEQMELLSPKITESSSTALLEWESKLSGLLFDCYGYSYEYTDKNGNLQTGIGSGDIPSFFVENVTKENTIPVKVTLRITPKKNSEPIIDTIQWTSVIPLAISESAGDVIFLKTPVTAGVIDLNDVDGSQSHSFTWTKVENVNSYTLKVSTSASFPADRTFEFEAGDASFIDLDAAEIARVVSRGSARCYWTVSPSSAHSNVGTQVRVINIYRTIIPNGLWMFDDPSDLFNANIGEPLIEQGPAITLADGPSADDKAVFVPEYSYLVCKHGLDPEPGHAYVNEFSVLMNLKLTSFSWFSIADINSANNNGEWFISPNGELSLNGWWNSSLANMQANTWHQVIYSCKLDESVKIYLDGQLVKTISTDASWIDGDYALRPELHLFKDDNSWNDRNTASVSEIIVWGCAINDMEADQLYNNK